MQDTFLLFWYCNRIKLIIIIVVTPSSSLKVRKWVTLRVITCDDVQVSWVEIIHDTSNIQHLYNIHLISRKFNKRSYYNNNIIVFSSFLCVSIMFTLNEWQLYSMIIIIWQNMKYDTAWHDLGWLLTAPLSLSFSFLQIHNDTTHKKLLLF